MWNDGDDSITTIDELGGHGGNATVLLRGLVLRYARHDSGNRTYLLTTVWTFARVTPTIVLLTFPGTLHGQPGRIQ